MFALVCSMCWNVASAQKLYAGDPYKWNELKAGDEILLNNGGAYGDDIAGYGGPGQFLCGATTPAAGWMEGITLAKTDTLNADHNNDPTGQTLTDFNVWILVDAGTITTLDDEEFQAFYLKNKKTNEYIECFEQFTKETFASHTTPQLAKATSFVPRPIDSYSDVNTFMLKKYADDPDYGVIFSHYVVTTQVNSDTNEEEQVGTWWNLGYAWNYVHSYYGTASDMVGWNVLRPALSQTNEMKFRDFMASLGSDVSFLAGTDPGKFGEEEVIAFENALASAQDAQSARRLERRKGIRPSGKPQCHILAGQCKGRIGDRG